MRRSSVRNAYDPAREGGVRSAMAYRPVGGLVAHLLTHSVFSLFLGGGPFDKFNPLTGALSISLNGM